MVTRKKGAAKKATKKAAAWKRAAPTDEELDYPDEDEVAVTPQPARRGASIDDHLRAARTLLRQLPHSVERDRAIKRIKSVRKDVDLALKGDSADDDDDLGADELDGLFDD